MKKSCRSMILAFLAVAFCSALLPGGSHAFVVTPSLSGTTTRNNRQLQFLYASSTTNGEEFSETETEEMRDLILSLSKEPTDHDRRTRVRDVFHEALARPNGMPARFTALFDKVLTEVGEQVQNEAKKRFFEDQAAALVVEQQESSSSSSPTDESTVKVEEEEDLVPQERMKSPDEFQLWALVDMMVQSKTIVKKESGELGNKGTFQ
mmetsp:Transcript_29240/g.83068  ORF Transcript_29240/g.83068 Transcript_29240/m.83068 type:complete len:207 (+) Transcript_29240:139-759(+)